MTSINFSTLKVNNSLVKDWEVILKCSNDSIRLYLEPSTGATGFHAVAVEFASSEAHDNAISHWDLESLEVEVLHEINASSDGVRHHYVMNNADGYLHYPDLDFHVLLFQKLIELELKYCPYANRHSDKLK